MLLKLLIPAFVACQLVAMSEAKIYDRCEFVRLARRYFPANEIDDWTCIAKHESRFNTKAINTQNGDRSIDYGIFQINNRYWCGNTGANVCRVRCEELQEDNLVKSITCAKTIRRQQGFSAWVAWTSYCSNGRARGYAAGC